MILQLAAGPREKERERLERVRERAIYGEMKGERERDRRSCALREGVVERQLLKNEREGAKKGVLAEKKEEAV